MTNELEKQFFDKFGIEPKLKTFAIKKDEQGDLTYPPIYEYPQITNRILLELILINMHNEDLFGYPTTVEELKHNTLKQLIETYSKFSTCVTGDGEYQQSARDIKHKIHTLFEES